MLNAVFGFTPGQTLKLEAGLNEYLSALLAMTQLQSLLNREQLLQVFMCIEATIPFRKDGHQELWSDRLFSRCFEYVTEEGLYLSETEVATAVQRAVLIGNLDAGGFYLLHEQRFLENTWKYIARTHHNLRRPGLYTLHQYHEALMDTYLLMEGLKNTQMFSQFRGRSALCALTYCLLMIRQVSHQMSSWKISVELPERPCRHLFST